MPQTPQFLDGAAPVDTERFLVTQKSAVGSPTRHLNICLKRLPLLVIFVPLQGIDRIHRGKAVKEVLGTEPARRLPAYAPELNPVEGLWRWLERAMGNICCENLLALRDELVVALARLRRRRDVLDACFKNAGLQI